jgi:AraC-like DNA-binding protein
MILPLKIIDFKTRQIVIYTYLILQLVIIIVIAVLYWKSGYATGFMWFLLVPIGASTYAVNNLKIWIAYSFACILMVLIITPFLPNELIINNLSQGQIKMINLFSILFMGIILSFFILTKEKIDEAKLKLVIASTEKPETKISEESKKSSIKEDAARDAKIFADICEYFENKKPYTVANYTIAALASEINVNINYISIALKANGFKNFNTFVNAHRINLVKQMFDADVEKNYVFSHLYTSAGFRNQSTFNKAFRLCEGISPSEYVAKKKAK